MSQPEPTTQAAADSEEEDLGYEADQRRVLVARVRVAAWATIATAVIFALGDIVLVPNELVVRYALKLPQVLAQVAMLLCLQSAWGKRHVVGVALASIAAIGISVATGSAAISNTTIPALQLTGVAVVTAVFFPWGALPQLMTVGLLSAALALNLVLVGAPLGYSAIGAFVFMLWSVYFAQTMANERRTLFDTRAALVAKNRELEEADRRKSEFLATISHDLRTPLNVILGYSEMLADEAVGPVNAEQRELLESIQRYSRLQLDMVSNVLDFSRLTAAGMSVRVESFAIEPLLSDLRQFYAPLTATGVCIGIEVAAGLHTVETDRVKLQEALRNLVENAVKFTEHGSIMLRASGLHGPQRLRVEVADTGAGIPPLELPQIFVAFRQGAQPNKAGTTGVGLGLAIVKQLVDVLGGTIEVESELGRGTTFRIELPTSWSAASAGDSSGPELGAGG